MEIQVSDGIAGIALVISVLTAVYSIVVSRSERKLTEEHIAVEEAIETGRVAMEAKMECRRLQGSVVQHLEKAEIEGSTKAAQILRGSLSELKRDECLMDDIFSAAVNFAATPDINKRTEIMRHRGDLYHMRVRNEHMTKIDPGP